MAFKQTTESAAKLYDKELLSLVAEKLKGKTLFPKMMEQAKEVLNNITVINVKDFHK